MDVNLNGAKNKLTLELTIKITEKSLKGSSFGSRQQSTLLAMPGVLQKRAWSSEDSRPKRPCRPAIHVCEGKSTLLRTTRSQNLKPYTVNPIDLKLFRNPYCSAWPPWASGTIMCPSLGRYLPRHHLQLLHLIMVAGSMLVFSLNLCFERNCWDCYCSCQVTF